MEHIISFESGEKIETIEILKEFYSKLETDQTYNDLWQKIKNFTNSDTGNSLKEFSNYLIFENTKADTPDNLNNTQDVLTLFTLSRNKIKSKDELIDLMLNYTLHELFLFACMTQFAEKRFSYTEPGAFEILDKTYIVESIHIISKTMHVDITLREANYGDDRIYLYVISHYHNLFTFIDSPEYIPQNLLNNSIDVYPTYSGSIGGKREGDPKTMLISEMNKDFIISDIIREADWSF